MNKAKKIFTVIVTYNGSNWVEKSLTRLQRSYIPVQTIIIDNGSIDGTKEIIKNFPEVTLIESSENLGFGAANNKGIEIAIANNADYIFLLNQDAWVEENTIQELLIVAENNPDYGIISPVHLNGTYSALDIKFSEQVAPNLCPSFYSDTYINKPKPLYRLDFINAAAWFISRACINKVGFFEPVFFLYGEDNNFLQRTAFHGFKVGVTPLCTICHDREIRKGKLNETGVKNWERTYSLITLLNILDSYNKCIVLFLKQRVALIFKSIYKQKLSTLKYAFKELLFFFSKFVELKKIRNYHKLPGINK